jgi:hypothetical protein
LPLQLLASRFGSGSFLLPCLFLSVGFKASSFASRRLLLADFLPERLGAAGFKCRRLAGRVATSGFGLRLPRRCLGCDLACRFGGRFGEPRLLATGRFGTAKLVGKSVRFAQRRLARGFDAKCFLALDFKSDGFQALGFATCQLLPLRFDAGGLIHRLDSPGLALCGLAGGFAALV